MDELTNKREAFVQALIAGKSQREAYNSAYNTSRMKDKTVDEKASRLFADSKVWTRYDELLKMVRGESARRVVASAADVLEEISSVGMGTKEYPTYDMFGKEHKQKPGLPSRLKELELLGKHHKLFTEQVQMSGNMEVQIVDDITEAKAVRNRRPGILWRTHGHKGGPAYPNLASWRPRLLQVLLCGRYPGQMDLLYDRLRSEMEAEFGSIYAEGYYHKHYDLQTRAGWLNEVAKLTPGMIQDAVSYPWSGANFSDRLWKNKEALLFNLRETVTQSLIQGRSLPETSKALAGKLGQSYKAAERLVRTETNHLHNRADLDAYEAAGVEEYEFMATLDSRTSEVCAALDGKHFKLKDAVPGENLPPMHPNCRSTTVEYDPEEAADWAASQEKIPEHMTYAEWYQKQVAKHGEGYVELERKKAYRESTDRAQWERYSDLLGKDAPKKFKAFQDIKYGDADTYRLYKLDYSRRSRLLGEPERGLPGAGQAKAEDNKFLKYLFNPEDQRGYAKGLAFNSRLGYDETNWKQLQKEILNRAVLYPARQAGDKGFGMTYEQKMILYGKTGKPTNVMVSWIDDAGSPRMTSAYIKEVKEHEN